MENEIFKKLYAQLNPKQKEAVDTLEGPVMVVAGPGTGKTQVLTLRIANILLQGEAKPEEILALTFTESGVAAMRKRLIDILGPRAYYIPIHTFHAFCNEIIQTNPDDFPQFFDKKIIDEIGQMEILESVLEEGRFKLIKPFGDNFMYVAALLKAFSDIKREGIGPQKLHKLVQDEAAAFEAVEDLYHEKGPYKGKMKGKYLDLKRNIEKNREIAATFEIYQDKLRELGYDYDDIILSVVEKLEENYGEGLLVKLAEQYKYLLADEHQDTNRSQNKVLELLCADKKTPNIFVVGDEKQSIYRFQGANLANFLSFHSRFPGAKIITLQENYRSCQKILDAAGSVIENNSLHAASRSKGKGVFVYSFESPDTENYFIAQHIKKLIKQGAKPQEIAVLYRDNRDVFPIKDILQKTGVPYRVESDEQVLENNDIKNLFLLIKSAVAFGSDEALARAFHADFLKIPPLDIYKLLNRWGTAPAGRGQSQSLYDTLRNVGRMRKLGVSRAVRLNNLYKKLSSWNKLIYQKSAPQVFEYILHESGFLDQLLKKSDYIEGIGRVRLLHNISKKLACENQNFTFKDFVAHLDLMERRGVLLRERRNTAKQNAVRLMTAHRAKGLEFDYVFIAGANMGHWGKRHTPQLLKPPLFPSISTDKEDDERRLFYVALTRARNGVCISYPCAREDGRELFPAQFIEEIHENHKILGNSKAYEKSFASNPKMFFVNRKEVRSREDEKEFLREVFGKRGLSPTALNNYIECPWKYFYNNLLQIPRAKTKHEMYGTAVHAALRDLFYNLPETVPGKYKGQSPKDYLLEAFERALSHEPISEHDFNEALAKGKETLAKYFENYHGTWHTNTINEFAVKNVLLDGEVRLTGKIDKIEVLGGNMVNVVDYKTGRRKTRNELEGKTKNSIGNEKRQLVFYKLLLERCGGSDPPHVGDPIPHIGRLVMASGEIDFVEPEKNTGKFYKEKFIISNDDVRELEYKIQDVTAEILGLSFWNERCENRDCEYCRLREMVHR